MNTILFDKNYTKLPAGIKTARLVGVEAVSSGDLTYEFVKYDTTYYFWNNDIQDSDTDWSYPETGDYLCLVLKSDSGAIFTMLRKDNLENRRKYMTIDRYGLVDTQGRTGKEFQIIIKEG